MAFWEKKTLAEMTDSEWESLCDGCGLCCLHKLEDIDTLKVEFTCVKCRYLDQNLQCDVYDKRVDLVEDCLNVRDLEPEHYRWLPDSCAYRRIYEERPLPKWHPLITGDRQAMEVGGYAVGDWAVSDALVTPDADFIVRIKASDS
jgi:uncharacterized cysteine cluster protein YcgN (CxxCxxCC family)